jgi:hypothetical protein
MGGAPVLIPVRREMGVRGFGVNCWTAPVGEAVIERHSEPGGDEELYVVLSGEVRVTAEGDSFDAPAGTLIRVLPNTLREAVATAPGTVVLAVGAKRGEPFEPKPWEDFHVAFAQARAGGEERARSLVQETLARDPNAWQGAYNAACFEALFGDADAALGYLARALELGPPEVRQLAAEGAELSSLRSHPRWQDVVGEGRPA